MAWLLGAQHGHANRSICQEGGCVALLGNQLGSVTPRPASVGAFGLRTLLYNHLHYCGSTRFVVNRHFEEQSMQFISLLFCAFYWRNVLCELSYLTDLIEKSFDVLILWKTGTMLMISCWWDSVVLCCTSTTRS